MPFVDEPSINFPVAMTIGDDPVDEEIAEKDIDAGAVVKAALATDNTIGSWLMKESGQPDFLIDDPDFNPLNHINSEELLDESFLDEVAYADSVSEIDAVRRQRDFEVEQRQVLNDAGGWGFLASVAAGTFDPINLIPVGGTAYRTYRTGASVLKNAAVTGSVAAGSAAVAEAALHLTQIERTMGESAANITGALLLGGALGAGAGKLAQLKGARAEKLNRETADAMEVEAKIQEGQNPAFTREDAQGIEDVVAGSTTGAFEVPKGAAVIKGRTARAALKVLNGSQVGGNPLMRNAMSELPETRQITLDLAENPLDIDQQIVRTDQQSKQGSLEVGAEDGKPPVFDPEKNVVKTSTESTIKTKSDNQVIKYLEVFNDQYKKYLKGTPRIATADVFKKTFTKKKSATEFAEAASDAFRNNDKHDIPEVQAVAEAQRKFIYSPNLKAAQETINEATGKPLLPVDIEVKTAPSYLNRVWDTLKLTRGANKFKGIVSKWLAEEDQRLFAQNQDVMDRFSAVNAEIKETDLQLDLRLLKDKLTTREATLKELEATTEPKETIKGKRGKGIGVKKTKTREEIKTTKNEIQQVNEAIVAERERIGVKPGEKIVSDKEIEIAGLDKAEVKRVEALRREAAQSVDTKGLSIDEIRARKAELKRIRKDLKKILSKTEFKKARDFTRQDYDALASEINTRISTLHDGALPYDYKIGERTDKTIKTNVSGPLARRSFEIPDEWIKDFLVNDSRELAQRYSRKMVTQIEFINRYGDLDMSKQVDQIKKGWQAKIDEASKTNPDLAEKLAKKRDRNVEDLGIMRDRIQGRYHTPENHLPDRMFRSARDLAFMRLMGGVVAASVPDVGRIVAAEGFVNVFRHGLIPLVTNLKAFRMSALDARSWGVGGDGLMGGRNEILADINSHIRGGNLAERSLRAGAKGFSKINLMNQWTASMKQLHAVVNQTKMIKAIKAGKWDKRFGQLGISKEDFPALLKQLKKHGQTINGVEVANTKDWDSPDLALLWGTGLRKDSDKVILVPGQEKPALMSQEGWKTLLQFKSFMVSATSRIMVSNLQRQDAHYMQGMLAMVSLGMMIHVFKEWDAGREVDEDPLALVLEGIDRSGMMGMLTEANNTFEKLSGNDFGVRAMLGVNSPAGRYASRNMVEAFAGPTFGSFTSLAFGLIGTGLSDDEWTASDTRAARRILPYQNLSILRQGFDSIEAGINRSLGVTPISRRTEGLFE